MPETVITERAKEYAGADRLFAAWLSKVDAEVERRSGVSVFDLSDYCLRDAFDDGVSPSSAARAALANDA